MLNHLSNFMQKLLWPYETWLHIDRHRQFSIEIVSSNHCAVEYALASRIWIVWLAIIFNEHFLLLAHIFCTKMDFHMVLQYLCLLTVYKWRLSAALSSKYAIMGFQINPFKIWFLLIATFWGIKIPTSYKKLLPRVFDQRLNKKGIPFQRWLFSFTQQCLSMKISMNIHQKCLFLINLHKKMQEKSSSPVLMRFIQIHFSLNRIAQIWIFDVLPRKEKHHIADGANPLK